MIIPVRRKQRERNGLIAGTVESQTQRSWSFTLVLLRAQTQGYDLSSEASCPLHGCPLLGPSSSARGSPQPRSHISGHGHTHFATHLSSTDCPYSALSTSLRPSVLTLSVVVSNSTNYLTRALQPSRPLLIFQTFPPAGSWADKAQLGSRPPPTSSPRALVSFS